MEKKKPWNEYVCACGHVFHRAEGGDDHGNSEGCYDCNHLGISPPCLKSSEECAFEAGVASEKGAIYMSAFPPEPVREITRDDVAMAAHKAFCDCPAECILDSVDYEVADNIRDLFGAERPH